MSLIMTFVCLSVTLCIVAKRYILQQVNTKCQLGTRFYNFRVSAPYTDPERSKTTPPNARKEVMHQNKQVSKAGRRPFETVK